MPANNLQILQTQLLTLRRQEAGILSIQSTLGGQVSAVEQQLDAAVLVAEAATAALSAIQTTVATVSNTQTSLDATLGTVQADINRVDSQVTSASSSSGHTRGAVQSLVQQLVHPDATWEEGSSSYTLPVDAVPIYQAIQNETTSLDARVTAAATGSSVEVFDTSSGQLLLNFIIEGTVYAVGTPTGDVTHDVAEHALVLPNTSSHIVKAPSQPDFSFNHTWYMVLSLDQTGGQQYLWQHGDLSMRLMQGSFPNNWPCNSVLLQRTGDSDINTRINLSGSGPPNVPINTPIVVTWYYGNDSLFVLINGSHVWSSPKVHTGTYTNDVGTEGKMMADGTSGKLYGVRVYSAKHDDVEINNTIQSISTELNLDLSTRFAFAS